VTSAFADVARQQVVDAATRAAAAAGAGDLPASGTDTREDIAARAEVLVRTAQPVRVLSTVPPVQTGPAPLRNAATGGVLGVILAATLLAVRSARPVRVSTGRDAGELFGLPAGVITAGQVVPGSERLIEELQQLGGRGAAHQVLVVPAGPSSTGAAQEVAAVLRDTIPARLAAEEPARVDGGATGEVAPHTASWVRVTGDPSATVVAPLLRQATAVVLAVERGAPLREVRAVQRVSRHWERRADAVIVTG
jgi:hypothetical protein